MSVVKLGFIGPGIAARDLHWPALKDLGDRFQVVAVCGRGERNAKDFAALVGGAAVYADHRQLLDSPEVEAVVIATPFDLNLPMTRAALAAGKHVLVEKPLAGGEKEARTMRDLESRTKLVTMVAENWRYKRIFRRMKELIEEGAIGRPFSAFMDSIGKFNPDSKYFSSSTWRLGTPDEAMFMYDVGVHLMAALRLVLGEVESGIAATTSLTPGLGKIDSLSYQLNFRGGAHAVLNYYINSIGYSRQSLVVLGSEGSLHAEEDFSRLVLRTQGGEIIQDVAEKDAGYTAEFLDFHACLREGKKSDSSFAQSYEDLRAISHALDSTRRWGALKL